MSYLKPKDPREVRKKGWSFNEQVGKNQAIDSFTTEIKRRGEGVEKMIMETIKELLPNDFYEQKIVGLANAIRKHYEENERKEEE